LNINEKIKIPNDSTATIASVGVMGSKFVNITPGVDNGKYLQDEDYIKVTEEADMNAMFENMNKVLGKVDILLKDVEEIIGNDTFKTSVVEMSENIKSASSHMDKLMETLERVAANNEGNVNEIAGQMNTLLTKMNSTMDNVEHMTANLDKFAGDPQTAEQLKETLANVASTSKNVASMAENMNGVFGDQNVADDLKTTISNAKEISERANKVLGKVEGVSSIEVSPSVEMLYSPKNHDFNTNFDLEISKDDTSLNLGVEDIGDHAKLNAQVGKRWNDFGARAGVIAGKPGVALDAYAGKAKFSAEAYDPNDFSLRLKSEFQITDDVSLLAQMHKLNKKDERAAYFGLKYDF
jgi:phospholipid/cholesterol/gamma-HCH transport system substrate-binding protein